MLKIITIETPSLGDRSYLAHDGDLAVVVDPQRDIDRVQDRAIAEGVDITHVFETHIHNDYVSGGLALAQATGARYVVAADDDVAFDRLPAHDGDRYEVGRMVLQAVATPGHTRTHLAYQLSEELGEVVAVFTGGSMLFGAVGRTDLLGPGLTDELTRSQYRSVRRLARDLGPDVEVHPTHGFGSFCSATKTTTGTASTIGAERIANIAVITEDEETFVERLVAGLGAYPRYYAHMGPANLAGPTAPDLRPPRPVEVGELHRRIDAGEWVVDLRARRAFARRHVRGTISVELGSSFATFLGWTIPWSTPLTLVGESAAQVADAQRELTRIGVDWLSGSAVGELDALMIGRAASYEVASFEDLQRVLGTDGIVVLDVRRPDEWAEGHLEAASHIPFWELEARVGELADGVVWVHCASGFRASISASILDRTGRRVVHVDDTWERAVELGLPMAIP